MGFSMVDLVNLYLLGKKATGRSVLVLVKNGNSIYIMVDANVFQIQILAMRTLHEKSPYFKVLENLFFKKCPIFSQPKTNPNNYMEQ